METKETSKINITGSELRAIMKEYEFDPDIMVEDSQKVRLAKMALAKLNPADRTIFCLYLDRQSSRETGKILGCSRSTVLKQLQKIKMDIMMYIMELSKDEPLED